MKKMSWLFGLTLFFTGFVGCSQKIKHSILAPQVRNQAINFKKASVVLVSLDGFRADYLEKYQPSHLLKFLKEGVHVAGLKPVFPSLTFPNHYTMATGLYVENHGLLANSFYDPKLDREYRMGDASVSEGSWYAGTPLWNAASQHGMVSASYFWVGSEAKINGRRPDEYYKYDISIPNKDRVDKVLEWLSRGEEERPHMITLYFSDVDTAGHEFGPDSEQVKAAVLKVDQDLARLFDETAKLTFPVDVIVVSDHGMQAIDPVARGRALDGTFNEKDFRVMANGGTQLLFYAKSPSVILPNYRRMKKAARNYTVTLKKDIPEKFHFKNHPSAPDILVSADLSYTIGMKNKLAKAHKGGAHGYDPINKSMWGFMVARGPAFRAGVELPVIENVNVAPLVLKLLEITPEKALDGNAEVFAAGLLPWSQKPKESHDQN